MLRCRRPWPAGSGILDPKERNAMEIRQFRVVVRVSSFERGLKFYGDALALPKIQSWERDDQRGVVFLAGSSLIEMLGPPAGEDPRRGDERYNPQGPRIQVNPGLHQPPPPRGVAR